MPETDLAHRPGVELVNVGSWQLLSGSWNPNRTDILAAVEAARCPAVRRPRLKLGHLDPRFNEPDEAQNDGTPSLGWFDNLRASDDGNTLIGDQVALPWLSQVQAAAYPDRSVEGTHNARCALGHVHPFVITAVSLLGETPPGIPTLRSIKSVDDLPAALGVAASGEDTEGGETVQATIRAAAEPAPDGDNDEDDEPTGAMVALIPTAESAARLAVDGGEPAEQLHLTLAYLGEAADLGAQGQQDVIDAISACVNGMPTVDAQVFAASVFNPGSTDKDTCLVYGVGGDFLDAVHDFVMQAIGESAIGTRIPPQLAPWVAHVTAVFTDELDRIGDLVQRVGPVSFDRVRIAFAGQTVDIPLIDWAAEPDDPTQVADEHGMVAAAAGNAEALHAYWTTNPKALAQWRDKPHPWTALYKNLRKYLSVDVAKRTASKWFIEVTGHTPNQGVKAAEAPPAAPTPELPAAEPEQPITDPKEDLVSTELSALRSRLGLEDSADLDAITAAVDELKAKADIPPAPTEEMVAASAAAVEQAKTAEAEKDELRKEVQILASQMKSVSDELAETKAEKAATVKASVLTAAINDGKIKPADREQWETDYDEAPAAVTRVLASLAVGTAVPVMASGTTGPAEPEAGSDAEWNEIVSRLDGPNAKAV